MKIDVGVAVSLFRKALALYIYICCLPSGDLDFYIQYLS